MVDPVKPKITGDDGVYRGGSWGSSARTCRSAHRGHDAAFYAFDVVGFRVAADFI